MALWNKNYYHGTFVGQRRQFHRGAKPIQGVLGAFFRHWDQIQYFELFWSGILHSVKKLGGGGLDTKIFSQKLRAIACGI